MKHIKIAKYKGISNLELNDLGDLVIVCGPNDSGKTSFLEAIASAEHSSEGIEVTELVGQMTEAIPAPPAKVRSPGPLSATAPQRHPPPNWRKIIQNDVDKYPIWYRNDLSLIAKRLVDAGQSAVGRPIAMQSQALEETLASVLPVASHVVLVPAKRQIRTRGRIDADKSDVPNGLGILQALFQLKNQRRDSDGYQKYLELVSTFSQATDGYQFDTIQTDAELELCFSRDSQTWLSADDCGLGLGEMLLILYFCTVSPAPILAIEEPENHLHPQVQRRLLRFFENIKGSQIFLSTHSNIFLSSTKAQVLSTKFESGVSIRNMTSRARMLSDLGYSVSDNLLARVIVLVEGPSDVGIVDEFFKKLGVDVGAHLRIWPLGGDIMAQLDLEVMAAAYRTFALVDNDPKSGKVRKQFEENCRSHRIAVTRLQRYSIENYFTVTALKTIFPDESSLVDLETIDPNKPIQEQLGFSPKRQNREVARSMSLQDISNTDLSTFLHSVSAVVLKEKEAPVNAFGVAALSPPSP